VGSNVFALGYPMALSLMGEEVKFTDGKISSKTGFQGDITTYQISVPIQPGNSGGPLFDYDGNIVGITNAGINKAICR
jgi:S1-C subfamily serine protease